MAAPAATPEQHQRTLRQVEAHGNVTTAARKLGVPRATMQARYREARRWANSVQTPSVQTPEPVVEQVVKPRVRVQAKPTGEATRIVAIGDAHDSPAIPDKRRFTWIGRHVAATKPDKVVSIGDFLTMDSLNSHIPNESLKARQKTPFLDDMASGAEAFGALDAECKGVPKIMLGGNHEHRMWTWEDNNPEVAGHLTGEYLALLERFGWAFTRYGEWVFLAGVGFIHVPMSTMGKPYGGKTSEQRIANDAMFDIVFGHSHTGRVWRAPKIGPARFVNVVNLGCALPWGHIEDYALTSTTGWTWGIYDLEIRNGQIESAAFVSMLELERRYA